MVLFSSGDRDRKDKPHSGQPWTAVHEEYLDQLVHVNQKITSRELCVELNNNLSTSETMVAKLEYHKVCARQIKLFSHCNRKSAVCMLVRTY